MEPLCVHEATTLGFRDRVTEFAGSIQPELDSLLGVVQCLALRLTVGLAARELWDFRDESVVFVAPEDNDFVSVHFATPKVCIW